MLTSSKAPAEFKMINYDLLDSIANNHGASFYLFYPERFVHNLNEFSCAKFCKRITILLR
jgi:hypothetical protein